MTNSVQVFRNETSVFYYSIQLHLFFLISNMQGVRFWRGTRKVNLEQSCAIWISIRCRFKKLKILSTFGDINTKIFEISNSVKLYHNDISLYPVKKNILKK